MRCLEMRDGDVATNKQRVDAVLIAEIHAKATSVLQVALLPTIS